MRIALIGAMDVEIELLSNELGVRPLRLSERDMSSVQVDQHEVALAVSGIGKVAAASTTQAVIERFAPDVVVNTGIAGSLSADLHIGDLVVGTSCVQHDVNVEAFGYAPGQLPGQTRVDFPCDEVIVQHFCTVAEGLLGDEARVVRGMIVTGDTFVHTDAQKKALTQKFAGLCCEMEGAAIAQVAASNGVRFLGVRTISDEVGTDNQTINYKEFERRTAERSAQVVLQALHLL